jgi:hypothetical protein
MTLKARITAIDRFIKGCKEDGIYDDLKAACVMAGWDSLAGALTPLTGAAPTNSGFIATDYDRGGIGITGDGSSYVDSNRANDADPQSSKHLSVYVSKAATSDSFYSGAGGNANTSLRRVTPTVTFGRVNRSTDYLTYTADGESIGTIAVNRPSASATELRVGGVTVSDARPPTTYPADNIGVFSRIASGTAFGITDATLAFYSIGTSLDLALLDARVSTLMSDLRAVEEAGFDRDAIAYIRAVEAADGAYLETSVKIAINNLVSGLKADSLWGAIGSSCLLCGPRTLAGALVPLRGDAPTAYGGWASGDYDRATGLTGDPTASLYLDSSRANDADQQDDKHASVYVSNAGTVYKIYLGALSSSPSQTITQLSRLNATSANGVINGATAQTLSVLPDGFFGMTRSSASSQNARIDGVTTEALIASNGNNSLNLFVFARNTNGTATEFIDATIAFYSIGSSVDLAKLDSHISSYVTAIGAAI